MTDQLPLLGPSDVLVAERPGTVRIPVYGHPAPQGSKRAFRNKHTDRIQQVESSPRVAPWRQDVRQAIADHAPGVRLGGALAVMFDFRFVRPKGHYRTGRNAHLLRDSAPPFPAAKKDDLDKLCRSTLDAMTSSGLIEDDGLVVRLTAGKSWTTVPPWDRPGALIAVRPLVAGGGR